MLFNPEFLFFTQQTTKNPIALVLFQWFNWFGVDLSSLREKKKKKLQIIFNENRIKVIVYITVGSNDVVGTKNHTYTD